MHDTYIRHSRITGPLRGMGLAMKGRRTRLSGEQHGNQMLTLDEKKCFKVADISFFPDIINSLYSAGASSTALHMTHKICHRLGNVSHPLRVTLHFKHEITVEMVESIVHVCKCIVCSSHLGCSSCHFSYRNNYL